MSASSIPSAQVTADGQPRFHLPAPASLTGWNEAATDEEAGGVSADIRIFLDAQLGDGDVLVDQDPGFGFVALGAATAPGGLPSVFVSGVDEARLAQLQAAASDVGATIDAAPGDRGALQKLVNSRMDHESRLFVHVAAAQVASVFTTFREHADSGRLVAVCISDAHRASNWSAAGRALSSAGFVACAIAERQGQAILMPQPEPPTSAVIALPSELVNGA
ncbi:MAG: hypothetical protein IBJ03_06630 [Gemmatimonadaceae bacterium]|nr:hypothetical protein [Gemmatimonadaceae bacterium]